MGQGCGQDRTGQLPWGRRLCSTNRLHRSLYFRTAGDLEDEWQYIQQQALGASFEPAGASPVDGVAPSQRVVVPAQPGQLNPGVSSQPSSQRLPQPAAAAAAATAAGQEGAQAQGATGGAEAAAAAGAGAGGAFTASGKLRAVTLGAPVVDAGRSSVSARTLTGPTMPLSSGSTGMAAVALVQQEALKQKTSGRDESSLGLFETMDTDDMSNQLLQSVPVSVTPPGAKDSGEGTTSAARSSENTQPSAGADGVQRKGAAGTGTGAGTAITGVSNIVSATGSFLSSILNSINLRAANNSSGGKDSGNPSKAEVQIVGSPAATTTVSPVLVVTPAPTAAAPAADASMRGGAPKGANPSAKAGRVFFQDEVEGFEKVRWLGKEKDKDKEGAAAAKAGLQEGALRKVSAHFGSLALGTGGGDEREAGGRPIPSGKQGLLSRMRAASFHVSQSQLDALRMDGLETCQESEATGGQAGSEAGAAGGGEGGEHSRRRARRAPSFRVAPSASSSSGKRMSALITGLQDRVQEAQRQQLNQQALGTDARAGDLRSIHIISRIGSGGFGVCYLALFQVGS